MDEQTIWLRGLPFCVCRWGAGLSGVPVVFLHGWLDQGAAWDRTATALSAALGRPALAPDHRGHGRSAPAPAGTTYPFPGYLADVDALLQTLSGPVDLVGHSMGGTLAAQLAAVRPERVRRLVLIEGLGPPAVSDEDAADMLRLHLEQLQAPPTHAPLPSLAAGAARLRRLNPGLPEDEAQRLAARILLPLPPDADGSPRWQWRWDPQHRAREAVAFDVRRFRVLLGRIQAPTALLFGARSWYLQLPDLEERAARIPQVVARHTLPTGHSPHMDAPALLAEILAGVLA